MKIVREYALERINDPDNPYTLGDYHPNNFIVEQSPPFDVYAIDLDSYKIMDMKERLEKWERFLPSQKRYNQMFEYLKN